MTAHTLYVILLIIGLIAFGLAAIGAELKHREKPWNLTAIGLFFWLLVVVIQTCRT